MSQFEYEQSKKAIEMLVAKKVLKKQGENYFIEPDVELLFCGKLVRKLKEPKANGEQAMYDVAVEVLDEYDVFEKDGVSLDNILLVRVLLSFGKDDVTKKILKVKAK